MIKFPTIFLLRFSRLGDMFIFIREEIVVKFTRTSYLTRLAALGIAAATLLVPFSAVPAFAQTVADVNNGEKSTSVDANKLLSDAAQKGHVPTEAEIKKAIKAFSENHKNSDDVPKG